VYIGYHFRFATRAGMNLGSAIGNYAIRHNLKPLRPNATASMSRQCTNASQGPATG
jgi:hypothetical protein